MPEPGEDDIKRILYVVEVGPTMFQEKLPPQGVSRYEQMITVQGNDITPTDDGFSPLESDQKVSSGY
jgi:hypothetical protein